MDSSVGGIEDSTSRLSLEDARKPKPSTSKGAEKEPVTPDTGIKGAGKSPESSKSPVVVAIDFGTTFSNYAYLFNTGNKPHLQIGNVCARHWYASSTNLVSQKTPTTLLLNPDGDFVAFGYDAEKEYAELANNEKHGKYRYFRHFKMMLHNNKELKLDTMLKDSQGQEMPAIDVFARSISFLKEQCREALDRTGITINDKEIKWVLTIPAIWDPKSKQFMRKAAEKAGIEDNQLELALEPEAASVYVKEEKVEKKEIEDNQMALEPYEPGTKYMVLDLGGGTVDITVKEVLDDRTLRELHKATGNDLGGESVNIRIMRFIEQNIGEDVMEEFYKKLEFTSAVLDLENEIETKKRSIKDNKKKFIIFRLPGVLVELFENLKGKHLSEHIKSMFEKSNSPSKLKSESFSIHRDTIKDFFKPSLDSILQLTNEILSKESSQGVKDMIMVGGFAQCELIQTPIKEAYNDKLRVIVPSDPELAVLKGAVLYRNWPEVVSSRLCPFTYGSRLMRAFVEGYDDPSKKHLVGNNTFSKDVFNAFAKVGQEFQTGETAEVDVYALTADMTKMSVHIYKSTEEDPKYCTDPSCSYLGKIVVDMPDTTGGTERCVIVSLTLGHTEIIVSGHHHPDGEKATVKLDMLC